MRPPAVDDEQSRLDAAIGRADDLLVSSLQRDEQRRRRRRRLAWFAGGIIMLAAIGLSLLLLIQSSGKESPADQAKAEQLSQEGWRQWQAHDVDAAATNFEAAVKLN